MLGARFRSWHDRYRATIGIVPHCNQETPEFGVEEFCNGLFSDVSLSGWRWLVSISFSRQAWHSPVRSVDQLLIGSRSPKSALHALHHNTISLPLPERISLSMINVSHNRCWANQVLPRVIVLAGITEIAACPKWNGSPGNVSRESARYKYIS